MSERFYPIKKFEFVIGSGFGNRAGGFHYGLDFEADDGVKIYSAQAGTVQYIGPASGYGQWIVIDSDDSQGSGCVEYGHMWDAYATGLKVGSLVEAGQHIGYVGSNGGSTGPHLHVTVWPKGHDDARNPRIDPLAWFKNARFVGDESVPEQPTGEPTMSDASDVRVQLRGPADNGWAELAPQPDDAGNTYSFFKKRNVTAQTVVEAIATLVFEATVRIGSAGRGVADYRKRKGDTVAGNAASSAKMIEELHVKVDALAAEVAKIKKG